MSSMLLTEGHGMPQVAASIACREQVNMRVAWRLACGLSQQDVAERYNTLFPPAGDAALITGKQISYWETWPQSGREPSLTALARLARVYGCGIKDLVADHECVAAGRAGQPDACGDSGDQVPAARPDRKDAQAVLRTVAASLLELAGAIEQNTESGGRPDESG